MPLTFGLDDVKDGLHLLLTGNPAGLWKGTHSFWVGTVGTQNYYAIEGRKIPSATYDIGGSLVMTSSATIGTTGTLVAWSAAITTVSDDQYICSYSTTLSVGGSSSDYVSFRYSLGFGSLDTQYPNFQWDTFGSLIARDFQHDDQRNISEKKRFAGFIGALVLDERRGALEVLTPETTVAFGLNAPLISASYPAGDPKISTFIFRGTNNSNRLNPFKVVLYGSQYGTATGGFDDVPFYGLPCATFIKYISDPENSGVAAGGGWETIEVGEVWAGTFYFEI